MFYRGSDYENLPRDLQLLHPVDLLALNDDNYIIEANSIVLTKSCPEAVFICPICIKNQRHVIHKVRMANYLIPYVKIHGKNIECEVDEMIYVMIPPETKVIHQSSPPK
jgi:hypothetical protein